MISSMWNNMTACANFVGVILVALWYLAVWAVGLFLIVFVGYGIILYGVVMPIKLFYH